MSSHAKCAAGPVAAMTFKEIGKRLGISTVRVEQLHARALRKLSRNVELKRLAKEMAS